MLPKYSKSSTIISGAPLPFVVLKPRINNTAPSLPGCPERCCVVIPGTRPIKVFCKLAAGDCLITSPEIALVEPVLVIFFCVP
ncbi:hypothetical protein D3C85_1335370 [compost metagenome]